VRVKIFGEFFMPTFTPYSDVKLMSQLQSTARSCCCFFCCTRMNFFKLF
jgi:hypothetical protein